MKKLMFTLAAASLAGLVQADWIQTGGGTYDYNAPANWSDGKPNGVFPATLTLEGAQTITFSADTSLPGGLTIAYKGNQPMAFVSDGTGAKTLTLNGDITSSMAGSNAAVVTFEDSLKLDLNGERTITASAPNGILNIKSEIANGSLVIAGDKIIKLSGANTYADGTKITGKAYVYMNSATALGSGEVCIEGVANLCSDIALVLDPGNNFRIKTSELFTRPSSSMDLGSGTWTCENSFKLWTERKAVSFRGNIVNVDGVPSPWMMEKWGSQALTTYTDWVSNGEMLTVGNGNWHFYGVISGQNPKIVGSTNTTLLHLYAADTFTGALELLGGNLSVLLRHATALPASATVKIASPTALVCVTPKASDILASGAVDKTSTGVLALGANQTGDFDLTEYPNLSIGAGNTDAQLTGTLHPNADGVLRLGGGGRGLNLISENALPSTGRVEIYGNVVLHQQNDFSGTVYVHQGWLELKNQYGGIPNADIVVYGKAGEMGVHINSSAKQGGSKRARNVTLYGGYLKHSGNKDAAVVNSIDKLVLDIHDPAYGVIGGLCQLQLFVSGKTATLNVGTFERRNNMMFRLQGTVTNEKAQIGGAEGENTSRLIVGNDAQIKAELVGGGGPAGTPTVSIYPYSILFSGVTYNVNDTMVTYGENGFRPLDLDTEFARTLTPGTVTAQNFMVPNGTTVEVAQDTTVNCIFMQGYDKDTVETKLVGTGTLKTSSGVLLMGYCRNKTPSVSCPIDFGDKQGVVWFANGKNSYLKCPLAGTKGAILSHYSGPSQGSGGGSLYFDVGVGDSTLMGDLILHANVYGNNADTVPHGCDIYNHAYTKLRPGSGFGGLYGTGVEERGYNEAFTIGLGNADGDFAGYFKSNCSIVKVGAGRQRFSGENVHTLATTVEAGVLQNDGAFTASATTVKKDATLAGSGAFVKLVTLEDGAKLEAGSLKSDDDQVMNLDGGLTLQGAATLDLVAKDKLTVGGVAVKGALTIPADKVVTVNVLLAKDAQGKDLKLKGPAQHVVFAAESPLTLANFKRGTNCGPLKLSADGMQVLMSVQDGFAIIVR